LGEMLDQSSEIKRAILSLLENDRIRVTPSDLKRHIRRLLPGTGAREIRQAVTRLVSHGRLVYSQQCGATHLESSAQGRTRLSGRIRLSTEHETADGGLEAENITIKLRAGASFGSGDHPTTALALGGLEVAIAQLPARGPAARVCAADVGTGSGILAIGAALLGVGRIVALDTDPLACHESRENIWLNGVGKQVEVVNDGLNASAGFRFALIMANLRPPTLASLLPLFQRMTEPMGQWVLSGFRPVEAGRLLKHLPANYVQVWYAENRGWAGCVIQRQMCCE